MLWPKPTMVYCTYVFHAYTTTHIAHKTNCSIHTCMYAYMYICVPYARTSVLVAGLS